MLESKQIVTYDDPSKTFLGVRFVLLGFDSIREDKVRSKVLEGGGIDAVKYGPDCNHVIVDKLVYDDPICISARRDGKTLVTGLWVDHSYDVGMPVDSSSVMYRPMIDLNGIPGANSLVICLTGYQRQDRDDIMTMVALMGANFSKPLVANKVTHLICYKFEGEKYELAKKMKKIKLVNHRWLEDCLKAWELLPEADYDRSGYELEMMAEAKDSEEETEDVATITDLEMKNIVGPQNTLIENRSFHHSPAKQEISISRNSLHPSASKRLANDGDTSKIHSTPGQEIDDRQLKMSSPFSAMSPEKISPQVPDNGTNISGKVDNALASATERSKKTPDADMSKLSTRSKFMSTPTKHTSPLRLVSIANKLGASGGFEIDYGVKTPLMGTSSSRDECHTAKSPSKSKTPVSISRGSSKLPRSSRLDIDCGVKTPLRGTLSPHDMDQAEKSPNKSKTPVSRGGSKSPLLSHDPKILMECEFAMKTTPLLASGSSIDHLSGLSSDVSPKTRLRKEASPKEALSNSHKGLKKQTSPNLIVKNIVSVQANNTSGAVEIQQSDVQSIEPTVDRTNSVIEKMDDQDDLNITNEGNTGCQLKPLKSKLLAKKTLGSRPTISKGTIMKLKGSLNLQNTIMQIDNVMRPNGPIAMEVTDTATVNDGTKAPSDEVQDQIVRGKNKEQYAEAEAQMKENSFETEKAISSKKIELAESKSKSDAKSDSREKKIAKGKKRTLANAQTKKSKGFGEEAKKDEKHDEKKSLLGNESKSKGDAGEKRIAKGKKKKLKDSGEDVKKDEKHEEKMSVSGNEETVVLASETNTRPSKKLKSSGDLGKENSPAGKQQSKNEKVLKNGFKADKSNLGSVKDTQNPEIKDVPACFILSGHKLQRKEFQQVIRRLKGRVCRDSHNWSYQATHFIVPDPIRRTEKFFAAAASGSWILKTDYLTASNEAGRLLSEEPYEWHKKCLTEDGAINLEAPRKWRLMREKTGHGACYGMRIVIYGECIAPPLDTLKRVIKAGDGTILATSPPYTRFFDSRIDFAIVSPGMPRVDMWVQEFLAHEVPCVVADYLVEYVCKPGFPLDRHVQYNTHSWAAKSLENLVSRVEDVIEDVKTPQDHCIDDVACKVCGSRDRGDEMLICGDESGSSGCSVGTHFDCLDPPLEGVPEDDWFCTECSVNRETKSVGSKKRVTKSKK